jgi:putative transposase
VARRRKKDRADELLAELVKGKTPEELLGEGGLLKQLTKRLVENALEGEMTEHLGYEPHAPEGKHTGNSRNGKGDKTIHTESGSVDIEVPRDRTGTFDPQLVRKRQRRLEGFDDKVLSLYARGMTTRQIQGHLKELYGTEVSPALISTVTDSVLSDVQAWQERPLDSVYPIVYLDALHLKMRTDGIVQTRAVYLALGVNLEGHKELLGLWIGEKEGSKFWLSILTELRNRGVQDILIACVDGLTGFPEAIASEFPKTEVQLCIVHMVRNSLRYVSWKERKTVAKDLRSIYTSPTADAAQAALDVFAEKWDKRFPSISRSWQNRWQQVIPFFAYPPEIRKVIYTTNAIESMQAQFRRVTRQRGAFPTPESAKKVLYLALDRISKRWSRPIRDWVAALNHFSIVFEDRIPL